MTDPTRRPQADQDRADAKSDAEIESSGGPLTPEEEEEVEEHAKLRPLAIYEVVRQEGVEELGRPWQGLWWSGLAAGLSIGISITTEGTLHALLPEAPWRPLVESLGYTVGFLIVILARQQLFTEITLTAVLPVLAHPTRKSLGALARNWSVVLVANLAGTAIFAGVLATEGFLPGFVSKGAQAISEHMIEVTPWQAFLRAVLSGWMMALLVWMLPLAEAARFWAIVLITYLIALFELSHVVAGSVEIFLLVFEGRIGLLHGAATYLLPFLAGNVIGGSALFALLAHVQVWQEMPDREARAHPASRRRPTSYSDKPADG
ncbi:formate/nitrite transporter family protein [Pseudoroseomonas sp. WGS1072]|uniref:formate/nitrite transporter family protein n=1 Tax=Roseomonas sp. WGS1072 TaxID=3366816 RepID=UPI003BF31E68